MVLLRSNRSIVLRLIQKATEEHPDWQLGKKALQKSLYFFNLKSNCFSFRWADFGPMSGEIQQIVHDLEACRRIKINPVETGTPNAVLKQMKYIPKDPDLQVLPDLDEALDETMKFVAGRNSRDLELLASVHFLVQGYDGEDAIEDVYQLLKELKSDAGFTKENVKDSIGKLKKHKIPAWGL